MGGNDYEAEFSGFVQGRWNGLVRTAYLLTGSAPRGRFGTDHPGEGLRVLATCSRQ